MQKKNKLSDLRDHLFETLEQLKDPNKPMEISRAKAIADVAQTIINSATVEVKAMAGFSQSSYSDFFDATPSALPPGPKAKELPSRAVDPLRQASPEPRPNGKS